MLAMQAIARTEQLLRQTFCSRLPSTSNFATEAATHRPSQRTPPPAPTGRKYELMVTPTVSEREYAAQVVHGRALLAPLQHEKTHGVPVVTLHVRGYNHRALDLFMHFASHAASSLAIPVSSAIRLPKKRNLWTVPKGPFVHKKAQENFERIVYKRMIKAWDATDNVVDRWLHYIQSHPQPGIGLRIVRWQRAPIGIGRKHTERTSAGQMESLRLDNITDRQRVEEVARNIVKQEMAAANSRKPAPKVITSRNETKKVDKSTEPQK